MASFGAAPSIVRQADCNIMTLYHWLKNFIAGSLRYFFRSEDMHPAELFCAIFNSTSVYVLDACVNEYFL